jgi:arsenate reductase-like glutaredoxin family protein
MSNQKQELLTVYHTGDDYKVSQILALAESDKVEAKAQNICNNKLTGTQLLTLSNKLDLSLNDLVDKESDLFQNSVKGTKYDEAGWLDVLTEHPELLKTPIVEKGSEIIIVDTPTDVLKMKNIDKSVDGYNHK